MAEEVVLKIGQKVMGNPYVKKAIQTLHKEGHAVMVDGLEVFKDGTGKMHNINVLFKDGDGFTTHKLDLGLFENPPSIEDLLAILPAEAVRIKHIPHERDVQKTWVGRRIESYAKA